MDEDEVKLEADDDDDFDIYGDDDDNVDDDGGGGEEVSILATCCTQTTTKASAVLSPLVFSQSLFTSVCLCQCCQGGKDAKPLSCSCSEQCDCLFGPLPRKQRGRGTHQRRAWGTASLQFSAAICCHNLAATAGVETPITS
jgi:hypothetical protein